MASQNNSIPKQVVCLVFYENNKILLEQRLDQDAFHKNWMFTGGKIEAQDYMQADAIHAAAVREAMEETGFKVVKTKQFISFLQKLRDGREFEFIGVRVVRWQGELTNREPHRRHLEWVVLTKAKALIGEHEVDSKILEGFTSLLY